MASMQALLQARVSAVIRTHGILLVLSMMCEFMC
jgi:hypothetical protein